MKTLTDGNKTIRVEWNGRGFDVYKENEAKDAFVFSRRLYQSNLTPRSRAVTIFNALTQAEDWDYESKLFSDHVC